ncbi:MAG: alpha/beta hydrolase [Pseudomonadota bacterium]
MPTLQAVDLPAGEATYFTAGPTDAPAVLLMHGGGLDCAQLSFRCLIPEAAKTHRVIAPNWPGYGGTKPLPKPYTIADLGVWMIGLLDALRVERASMIGISMGGGAALWMALNHGHRVDRLVPVATYGVADRAPFHKVTFLLSKLPLNAVTFALMRRSDWFLRRSLASVFADPDRITEELLAEVRQTLETAGDGEAFTKFQRGEMALDRLRTVLTPRLSEVSHKTLFIHGWADGLVPLAAVEEAARKMPHARVSVLDAGHWPMREQPEAFNALVTDFLQERP